MLETLNFEENKPQLPHLITGCVSKTCDRTFLPPSVLSWRHFQSTSCWGVEINRSKNQTWSIEIKNNQLTSSHSMYSGHGKCPSGSVSVSGAKITFKRLSKDFINPWKKSRRGNMFWPPSVFMTQLQRLWTHSLSKDFINPWKNPEGGTCFGLRVFLWHNLNDFGLTFFWKQQCLWGTGIVNKVETHQMRRHHVKYL